MNKALTIAVQDRIARITLSRPEVRNAFNDEVIQQLKAAFESVGARDDVRAVVLTGAGRAFSSGGDIGWMQEMIDDPARPPCPARRKLDEPETPRVI